MEKEIKKNYLIYKITNLLNEKIYVGAHTTTNINDKYFGSSKHLKKDIKLLGKENFKKEILFVFNTKEEMLSKEAEIVNKEFCHRTDTYNVMIGGIIGSFNYLGMTSVKDKEGNFFKVYLDDPRYLSGDLINVTKGTVPVIDKNGNNFRVSLDDSRYLSGELTFNLLGKVPVKDKIGNTFSVNKNDKRLLSGELIYICKGQVTVIDINGNTFSVSKNDPRYLSGELKHNLANTIVVKDKEENVFSVDKNDSRYLSGELTGWAKGRVAPNKGTTHNRMTKELKEHLSNKAKTRTKENSSTYGKIAINNSLINKKIKKIDLQKWLDIGWKLGCISKRTKESVVSVAKKYSSKQEFIKNEKTLYSYACDRGWLEDCYKHMIQDGYNTPGFRNKEKCIQEASKYKSKKEFRENSYAFYNAAYKNGWLEECCKHINNE